MTLKEWLKLSPNNICTLRLEGDEVRAHLYGEDAPERWRGKGNSEEAAIASALESRERVRSQLP